MATNLNITELSIQCLGFLSLDMINKANSGHPGLPLGCAAMAYTIWTRHLRHNPKNPLWSGRDRFILSGGHGSALLYSLLHLTGYDVSMDDLKTFRQWGSKTPGHPEHGVTPGVEVTTGPLGQGFANGVGFAIAQTHLSSVFNKPDFNIFNSNIYGIITDGDLMEGITAEAASFAGHLKLSRIIYLYDNNHISIDGPTSITFTESVRERFIAYGWQVIEVEDGNNVDLLDQAINTAKLDPRPSLIVCTTTIGCGLPTRQGTSKAHGEPPGENESLAAKALVGWPAEQDFYIPEEVLEHFREAINTGRRQEKAWQRLIAKYQQRFPRLGRELERRLENRLPARFQKDLPIFRSDVGGMATRTASGIVMNALAKVVPELLGGSADLAPSTKTWLEGYSAFQAETPRGRNFYFGIREHAMGAILNGMAIHGGLTPFGATFLVFADYMRTPIRLSAMSSYPSIWIFTHDSIGVGEDGPTHQPVEQLTTLRAIPGLVVIRPADANETSYAWKYALEHRNGPTAIILSRQDVPIFDRNIYAPASGLEKGAYVLADLGYETPDVIIMGSGSETHLALEAGHVLFDKGINTRVVSFPSWEIFSQQSMQYQDNILPKSIRYRISIEAGITLGWEKWVGEKGLSLGLTRFGASAPHKTIYQNFGLTVDNVVNSTLRMMEK